MISFGIACSGVMFRVSVPSAIAFSVLPGSPSHAVEFVISDFEQAYRAFALDMSSSMDLDSSSIVPSFVRSDDMGGFGSAGRRLAWIVFCSDTEFGSTASAIASLADGWKSTDAVIEGVYLVVVSSGYDASDSVSVRRAIAEACDCAGVDFRGDVSLGGGSLFARYAPAPRMGIVRHKISEAIDSLAHAVMAGEGLDAVSARLSLPRMLFERHVKAESEIR